MAAQYQGSTAPRMTGSQPSVREGAVSGILLKAIRHGTGRTQAQAAEALGMDLSSLQGWESGRRPLAATHVGRLREVRRVLLRLGAEPALLVRLDEALDADAVLSHALAGPPGEALFEHPLAAWVMTRDTTHLLAWALTPGFIPKAITCAAADADGPRPRRLPTPLLGAGERRIVFAHMRRAAELGQHHGEDGALLRRQALYLCSYDEAPDTGAWLADMRRRLPTPRHGEWTPYWADQRSVAASLTRHGDTDALRAFIADGMGDLGETANLNYWAYWLGIDAHPQPNDAFMITRPLGAWDAHALLRRLSDRLEPGLGCIDLNIHSVHSLIALHPRLLSVDPVLNSGLERRVSLLLDTAALPHQPRAELEQVHYGLRLHRA